MLNNAVTLKSGLVVTQGHSNWYHSKALVRFPIRFYSKSSSVLHHFRDKARYWSKIVIFSYPLHYMPPLGGPHRTIVTQFGMEKLEW